MRVPFDMFGTGQWQLLLDGVSAQEAFEKIKKKIGEGWTIGEGQEASGIFICLEGKKGKEKYMNKWNVFRNKNNEQLKWSTGLFACW